MKTGIQFNELLKYAKSLWPKNPGLNPRTIHEDVMLEIMCKMVCDAQYGLRFKESLESSQKEIQFLKSLLKEKAINPDEFEQCHDCDYPHAAVVGGMCVEHAEEWIKELTKEIRIRDNEVKAVLNSMEHHYIRSGEAGEVENIYQSLAISVKALMTFVPNKSIGE